MSDSSTLSSVTSRLLPTLFAVVVLAACSTAAPTASPSADSDRTTPASTPSPDPTIAPSAPAGAATGQSTLSSEPVVPVGWDAVPAPAGVEVVTVDLGERPFLLYRSTAPNPVEPTGLIVALHGYTAQALGTVPYFGLERAPIDDGLLVAVPQGTTDSAGDNFWNASDICCNFHDAPVDDVAYLSEVISTVLAANPTIDRAQVHVIGHSNGGYMASRLACERPDLVASIISFAGAFDANPICTPSAPVDVMVLHGDADEVVDFDGGPGFTSATQTTELWQTANGCTDAAAEVGPVMDADGLVPGDDLFQTRWLGCSDGHRTELWRLAGSAHSQQVTPALSRAILDWFEQA